MKKKPFFRILLLGGISILLGCFLAATLTLAGSDWNRFRWSEWPRNLEYNSLFWIEMCMAAVEVQILLSCIAGCVRLIRSPQEHREALTIQAWKKRLVILALAAVLLSAIAGWLGSMYYPMYRQQLDWAWKYANRYYLVAIADLFVLGALVRWMLRGIKLRENRA